MILLVDNYDSFTYNLFSMIETVTDCVVRRNDASDLMQLAEAAQGIVISPGPGRPELAGMTVDLVRQAKVPVLGVCLGHQAIAHALGGSIVRAPQPIHGKPEMIYHDGRGVFSGLQEPFSAARYHSLVVDERTLPPCLYVTARSACGLVMGVRHKSLLLEGVQFHPESIITEQGRTLITNFVEGIAA